MLFGKPKIQEGDYIFLSQDYSGKLRLVIGRVTSLADSVARVRGSYIIPEGLIERYLLEEAKAGQKQFFKIPIPITVFSC